ncbi:MAG: hypothetical protein ACYC2O_10200 [Microthrixaceae bacterium]
MNTTRRKDGPPVDDERVTRVGFTTTIRGRQVTVWLDGGRLGGDPELLRRLERVIGVDDDLDAVTVAHRIGDAVGSEVVLHLCAPADDAPSSG